MSTSSGSPLPVPEQGAQGQLSNRAELGAQRAQQPPPVCCWTWGHVGSHPGGVPQGRDIASQCLAHLHRKAAIAILCCHLPHRAPSAVPSQQPLTPCLSPHELQVLGGSKVFLDGIVHTLDEHGRQVGALQQVGHGGAVPEGVYGPARPRCHTCGHRDLSAPCWASSTSCEEGPVRTCRPAVH